METTMVSAVVFDMDGLLLDTERVACDAWCAAAAEFGYDLTEELYGRVIGRVIEDTQKIFAEALDPNFPFAEIRARRIALAQAIFEKEGIRIKRGALELLQELRSHGIPCAVATSTRRTEALTKLSKAGVNRFFAAIAAGDEVKRGKPAPDLFLLAAQRLQVKPSSCVVLEDAEAGVLGALAAGMRAFIIPDLVDPCAEVRQLATGIFPSLADAHCRVLELCGRT